MDLILKTLVNVNGYFGLHASGNSYMLAAMRRFALLVLCAGFLFTSCGQKTIHYGPYSIGRDQSWFPLSIGQHTPNLNAFTNALVQEIAETEDVPLHLVNINWVQLFQTLEQEEVAGIFTSLSPNVITQNKYTFSDPFLLLGPVLVVPYESEVTSLDEMEGKIVAINQFDDSILIVQKYPSIIIRLYQNMPTALEDLNSGKIDGVLMGNLDAHALVPHLYSYELKIATEPLNDKALRLITLKGKNQKLMKAFNRGLKKVFKTSNYTELREHFKLN